MHNRRSFLRHLGLSAATAPLMSYWNTGQAAELDVFFAETAHLNNVASDEDFWFRIQQAYSVSPNIINLNNGGVSPQPKVVQDTFENYNRLCNEAPSYYMWRVLNEGREAMRTSLAELAGCSPEEIATNRNSTEAIETVIFGLNLKKGDEVVMNTWDYPSMRNALKFREKRDGIKIVWVEMPGPSENADEIAKLYTDKFTDKTRLVLLTHVINYIGQVIPVRQIADAARQRGILSLVDGAHSFAHLDFKIPDLGCDFFGTSLHKWLCAPFGNGLLYMRKDKIASVYPIFPTDKPESDDIRKFENLGTRSFPAELATGRSIDFHNGIGSTRKYERLYFLKDYWTKKAAQIQGVKVHTPASKAFSGALALFSIEGKKPGDIESELLKKHGIHVVPIEHENISGVRVTPNVYTTLNDLDRLVTAIDIIASKKESGSK
ncbi:MAG: aminotransferase class V-fold PLP-dependent enzyme [Bacteroidia bacterium]|nr:aminotransferase class V-fold PLP-dependent enzyme [Bacteroidia bacterium]